MSFLTTRASFSAKAAGFEVFGSRGRRPGDSKQIQSACHGLPVLETLLRCVGVPFRHFVSQQIAGRRYPDRGFQEQPAARPRKDDQIGAVLHPMAKFIGKDDQSAPAALTEFTE